MLQRCIQSLLLFNIFAEVVVVAIHLFSEEVYILAYPVHFEVHPEEVRPTACSAGYAICKWPVHRVAISAGVGMSIGDPCWRLRRFPSGCHQRKDGNRYLLIFHA